MESAFVWLMIAALGGFIMAFANGANDVANSFASAVGAKAITVKQATLVAGLMNFLGAAMLGGIVSAELITGLIDPTRFTPGQYVAAMLAVLLASATFVLLATAFKLPVSSSHSIVGSLVGVSYFATGWESVNTGKLGSIAGSWVVSPALAALGAYVLLRLIRGLITKGGKEGVMSRMRFYLPYFLALAVGVFAVLLVKKSLKASHGTSYADVQLVRTAEASEASEGAGATTAAVTTSKDSRVPMVLLHEKGTTSTRFELAPSPDMDKLERTLRQKVAADNFGMGAVDFSNKWIGLIAFMLILVPYAALVAQGLLRATTVNMEDGEESAEAVFRRLQVGTSSYVAFAHGANDVANAIAPAFGIYLVYVANQRHLDSGVPDAELVASVGMPLWLLVLGGFGIAAGIGTLGHRVIETLSEKVTTLNNTRGFCVDFSAATTVVGASMMGLPVSSTHAATGSIMGSGYADGEAVKWGTLGGIAVGWVVTLPAAMLLAGVYYWLISQVVG